jgi:hypothetical protein
MVYKFIDYTWETLETIRPTLDIFGDDPKYKKLTDFLSRGRISNIKTFLTLLDEKDSIESAAEKFDEFAKSERYKHTEAKTPEYFQVFKSSGGNKQTRMKRRIRKGNTTRKMRGGGPSFLLCGALLVACRILHMLNNPSLYKFTRTSDFLSECYNQIVHIQFIRR